MLLGNNMKDDIIMTKFWKLNKLSFWKKWSLAAYTLIVMLVGYHTSNLNIKYLGSKKIVQNRKNFYFSVLRRKEIGRFSIMIIEGRLQMLIFISIKIWKPKTYLCRTFNDERKSVEVPGNETVLIIKNTQISRES